MLRDVAKVALLVPLLAGMVAFVYCWAKGMRAGFKWRWGKASEATEWREQFILYWFLAVLAWCAIAAVGWIMHLLGWRA